MKNPNSPADFPGQLRKAFVGTEPNMAPTPTGKNKRPNPIPPPKEASKKE